MHPVTAACVIFLLTDEEIPTILSIRLAVRTYVLKKHVFFYMHALQLVALYQATRRILRMKLFFQSKSCLG